MTSTPTPQRPRYVLFVLVLLAIVYFSIRLKPAENEPPHPAASVAPSAPAAAPAPRDPVRQKKCASLLAQMGRDGVLKSWQRDGDFVTVQVRPGYYSAEMDNKIVLDGVVRCAMSEGRLHDQGITVVQYNDAFTGKTVAEWGESTGFEMK